MTNNIEAESVAGGRRWSELMSAVRDSGMTAGDKAAVRAILFEVSVAVMTARELDGVGVAPDPAGVWSRLGGAFGAVTGEPAWTGAEARPELVR